MKTFSEQFLDPFFKNRPKHMSKPHVRKFCRPISLYRWYMLTSQIVINICYVLPSRRHEGIGNLMIEWGLKKADEMGVETWVESTQDGKDFYKRHGFTHVEYLVLDPPVEPVDNGIPGLVELKGKLHKKRILPFHLDIMKRTAGGKKVNI